MVGKPNLPDDGYDRSNLHGGGRATPGLTALDEQREASMADEGGASGMVMESEDEEAPPLAFRADNRRHRLGRVLLMGAAAGFVLAAWNSSRQLR